LRRAPWSRKAAVVVGAIVISAGAIVLSLASGAQSSSTNPTRGLLSAIGAGVVWGSMYIPYRKAYVTGMNPLTFLTYFTVGELGTMTAISVAFLGGVGPFWHELVINEHILFWPFLGGLMWVVGDLFQNYATKYVGISRGIPLSNTNQIWGLLWAILVFGELQGQGTGVYLKVIGGSVLMAIGAAAVALSSATGSEYESWKEASQRETDRYGIDPEYVSNRVEGIESPGSEGPRRTWFDGLIVALAILGFVALGFLARVPAIEIHWTWLTSLVAVMVAVLIGVGIALARITKFN